MTDTNEEERLTNQYQAASAHEHKRYRLRDEARQQLDEAIIHGSSSQVASAFVCYQQAVKHLYDAKLATNCLLTAMKRKNIRFLWLTEEHDPTAPVRPW